MDSSNLTILPTNTFGQGVIGHQFSLIHAGVLSYEANFLGDEDLVQHVKSIEIIDVPAK